jgi:hypothetical protein
VGILVSAIEQPIRERIKAGSVSEFVDRAFDAEGTQIFVGRAQWAREDGIYRNHYLA